MVNSLQKTSRPAHWMQDFVSQVLQQQQQFFTQTIQQLSQQNFPSIPIRTSNYAGFSTARDVINHAKARFPEFHGEEADRTYSKVKAFLDAFEAFFALNPDSERVLLVTYHFRVNALAWWDELASSPAKTHLLHDWPAFRDDFNRNFIPPDALQAFIRPYHRLKHTTTVSDYCKRFYDLLAKVPTDEKGKPSTKFHYGLKPHFRLAVETRIDPAAATLEDIIAQAILQENLGKALQSSNSS